jgi:ABC-2 type transport system ATP-binding protein
MNGSAAIVVEELTRSYAGVRALDSLSFEVRQGEIFGLVGPDGAGKTTTQRILAGILAPDSGRAHVAGIDVVREPERAKQALSYMPQRFGLYEDLTVDENVRFYADLFSVRRREREARAAQLLRAAGMNEFGGRLAGKLSGGMKQKLGLVCALIHRPQVVLLDEPTNGVDPVSRRDFWRILYELLGEGVAILTSTAYLDEAERCHRVALLDRGRLLFCDDPEKLKAKLGKDVLSIASSAPRRVRAVLERAAGIANVVMSGDGLHVVVDDAERRIPEFKRLLADAQVPCTEIRRTGPTIEDLFVHAVEGEADAHA